MQDAPPSLLAVDGLTYAYGARLAVDHIAFDVRRGEVFGLLGPNGAGKTTAIACLSGLQRPAGGTLTFDGAPFDPVERPADRARLGLVPQSLAVYDDLTALENLVFFAEMLGVEDPREAAVAGLALAGLQERSRERVRTFSGGMKRRLNLAAGLVHRPELTLLDEPTVGVDPQSRHHIFEALETLKAKGHSMLYTSHSMDEVERLCDRVAIMDTGRLLDTGTPAELAERAGLPGADLEATFLELTGHRLRDEA